jgi:hypothetical protein
VCACCGGGGWGGGGAGNALLYHHGERSKKSTDWTPPTRSQSTHEQDANPDIAAEGDDEETFHLQAHHLKHAKTKVSQCLHSSDHLMDGWMV